MLLLETPEAVECVDEILELEGIDKIHVGLNDLSLATNKKFMFELLIDGTVEKLCEKFKAKNLPYGFGGIASLGKGMVPAEMIIKEHYRLGSTSAILSRSFCNAQLINDLSVIEKTFIDGIGKIREFEKSCKEGKFDLDENYEQLKEAVNKVISVISV